MKLTIWQQFSSNHSNGFTVVGKFASEYDAKQAAATLSDIIQRIGEDYRSRYTSKSIFKTDTHELSTVEQEIKAQYKIANWDHRLEWTFFDRPNDTVRRYDKLVIVSNASETWSGYQPFDQLMQVVDGEAAFATEMHDGVFINLHCTAPDETVAAQIVSHATKLAFDDHYEFRVPDTDLLFWANIYRKNTQLNFDDILVGIGDYAEYQRDTVTILNTLVTYLKKQGCTNFDYDVYAM